MLAKEIAIDGRAASLSVIVERSTLLRNVQAHYSGEDYLKVMRESK